MLVWCALAAHPLDQFHAVLRFGPALRSCLVHGNEYYNTSEFDTLCYWALVPSCLCLPGCYQHLVVQYVLYFRCCACLSYLCVFRDILDISAGFLSHFLPSMPLCLLVSPCVTLHSTLVFIVVARSWPPNSVWTRMNLLYVLLDNLLDCWTNSLQSHNLLNQHRSTYAHSNPSAVFPIFNVHVCSLRPSSVSNRNSVQSLRFPACCTSDPMTRPCRGEAFNLKLPSIHVHICQCKITSTLTHRLSTLTLGV